MEQLGDTKEFTLVGYSYGSVITLELAALLEKDGKRGSIVLIDGAPRMLQQIVYQQISLNENQFQNNVILSILNFCMPAKDANDIFVSISRTKVISAKICHFDSSGIFSGQRDVIHSCLLMAVRTFAFS